MRRKKSGPAAPRTPMDFAAPVLKAIQWGLYLTFLTPLIVWQQVLIPHVTGKVLAFQVLTEMLCLMVVTTRVLRRERRPAPSISGWFTPTTAALAGFIGLSFVSALFGADLTRSLWGMVERQDGLVLLVHFLLWMMILAWTVRGNREPDRLLLRYVIFSLCVSVAGSLSILYESYQTRVPEEGFVLWRMIRSGLRAGGVFGNPTYAGPYLLFHLFLGLLCVWRIAGGPPKSAGRSKTLRAAAIVALLVAEGLIALALLVGQTRGVILGLAAGLAVMAVSVGVVLCRGRIARASAAAALLLLVVGAGAVWRHRDAEAVRRVPLLNRLTHVGFAESDSTRTRLIAWRSALRGFADRPVLGWGPRNVYYALNKYYDPRQVQFSIDFWVRSGTWYDKCHNAYLDLLADGGVIGIAGLLVLATVVIRSLVNIQDHRLSVCLAGALTAYAVSNLVAFDTFSSLLGLFLCLAAISVQERPLTWRRTNASKQAKTGEARPARGLWQQFAWGAGVLLVVAAIFSNVQIARAMRGYAVAAAAFEQDPGAGITLYESTFEFFSPYNAEEKLKCAYLTINAAITKRPSSRSFDAGSLVLRLTGEALRSHPDDAEFYLLLNDMYNGLAIYGDRRLADDAERFGNRALELSPGRQEVMFTLGRTYIIKGEAAKAVEINRRMVQEYPDFALGHWFLGLSYLSNSQRDEARNEFRAAFQKGYRFKSQQEMDTVKPLFDEKEYAGFISR